MKCELMPCATGPVVTLTYSNTSYYGFCSMSGSTCKLYFLFENFLFFVNSITESCKKKD